MLSCQCSAGGRACGAASDALRQQSSPQPCCSSCAVSLSASSAFASASVTETTRRHSRRRRGGALVLVVERCLRPAPDAVAARIFRPCRWPADGRLGRQPPVLKWAGTPPCLRRREESSAPDAVAVASADGPSWCVPVAGWWPSLRQPSAHNALGAWGTARNRRVDGSPTCGAERPAKRREGSVRTTKPAPSEYPHATVLGKFERRDKTRTFCLWALGRPTRRVGRFGLVDWL